MASKPKRPEYWELVDALVGMACQHLQGMDEELDDGAVSAGEDAIDVLTRLELVVDNKIVPDAFRSDCLRERFA